MADNARKTIARGIYERHHMGDWLELSAEGKEAWCVREADPVLVDLAAAGQDYDAGVRAERERCRAIAKGAWLTAPYGELADADAMCALSEYIEALILGPAAAPLREGTMIDLRNAFEAWAEADNRDLAPLEYEERTEENNHYYVTDSSNEAFIGWKAGVNAERERCAAFAEAKWDWPPKWIASALRGENDGYRNWLAAQVAPTTGGDNARDL